MFSGAKFTFECNYLLQELRCKEDELKERQQHQRQLEENLKKREKELDAREMELLGRELNIMITQNTPTPKKRKGKFSKNKLRVWIDLIIAYNHEMTIRVM